MEVKNNESVYQKITERCQEILTNLVKDTTEFSYPSNCGYPFLSLKNFGDKNEEAGDDYFKENYFILNICYPSQKVNIKTWVPQLIEYGIEFRSMIVTYDDRNNLVLEMETKEMSEQVMLFYEFKDTKEKEEEVTFNSSLFEYSDITLTLNNAPVTALRGVIASLSKDSFVDSKGSALVLKSEYDTLVSSVNESTGSMDIWVTYGNPSTEGPLVTQKFCECKFDLTMELEGDEHVVHGVPFTYRVSSTLT